MHSPCYEATDCQIMNALATQTTYRTEARARALYIVIVACFPVAIAGLLSFLVFVSGAVQPDDGVGFQSEFAEFSYPIPGDLVDERFLLSGKIKIVPAGEVVYLAELSEGRYWPKKLLGNAPTSFNRDQFANDGAGYKYSVVLLSVGELGKSEIEQWFEKGRSTGKYPGITVIEDSTQLARIRVVRR